MKNDHLVFDIYHRPTQSSSDLHYRSCHPQRNKNYIVLSLGQRTIHIVFEKKEKHLTTLKPCLIQLGHPEHVLGGTMTKCFSP